MDDGTIKRKLKTFICTELLRRPDYPLTDDEPMITSGLIDSFSLAQIGVFVEKEFGIYIPDTALTVERFDSLAQMVDQIQIHADQDP
jgi:acyl carrier protein